MCDSIKLEDEKCRELIVSESEIYNNFFVEAGAGSGKTRMLVRRMVAMVEAGIPINEICAITFTKAAALEFYERFESLLRDRSLGIWKKRKNDAGQLREPTDETKKLCKKALENINLCFMGTIDSFCNMIISEHPTEAGIPAGTTLLSDNDAEELYKKIYVDISNGKYGDTLKELSSTFAKVHWGPEKVFAKGMKILMDNRNAVFEYNASFKPYDIDDVYAKERTELIAVLEILLEHPEYCYDTVGAKNAWNNIPDAFEKIKSKWSSDINGTIKAIAKLKDICIVNGSVENHKILKQCFKPKGKTKLCQELQDALKDELKAKLDSYQYNISMQMLMASIPVIEQIIKQNGILTYFDYMYYLREMLVKDAKEDENSENGGNLIKYIASRHKYYLIDEFQDTNPLQAEIFFYLASDNPVKDWKKCKPRNGAFFIVGDPKQSIYRFNSADVASFLRVKEIFKGWGQILYLTQNFRSTPQLCEYFNRVFQKLLPNDTDNQSKYVLIPKPEPRDGEVTGVFTYRVSKEDAKIKNAAPDHIQIAAIINKIVDNEKYKIKEDNNVSFRRLRYSDIMVITANKKQLEPIMKYLADLDIPTKVEGKVVFKDNEALQIVSTLYKAVSDFRDQIALYAALRSKVFNLSNSDILYYKNKNGKVSLGNEVIQSRGDITIEKVVSAIKRLQEFAIFARTLSPAALLTKLAEDIKIYEIVSTDDMEVMYYALELLRSAEQSGEVVSLKDGAMFMDALLSGEAGEERCLSLDANADSVHIANLHKVKGLEAPVVILSAAGNSGGKSPTMRIERCEDTTKGYLFQVQEKSSNDNNFALFQTNEFESKAKLESEALKAEQDRLIYVAATRARNILIISYNVSKTKNGESKSSKWKPLIEEHTRDIFTYLIDDEIKSPAIKNSIEAKVLYEESNEESVLKNRTKEQSTYSIARPSSHDAKVESNNTDEELIQAETSDENYEEHLSSIMEPAAVVLDVPVDEKDSASVHAHYQEWGTMVHKLMEEIVSSGEKVLEAPKVIDMKVKEIVDEFWKPKMEDGSNDAKKSYVKILTLIANTVKTLDQTSEVGKVYRAMLKSHEKFCEVPFYYKDENNDVVWNGIIDALYKDADGKWQVVDYKTNVDKTVEELKTTYKNQMTAYIKACEKLLTEENSKPVVSATLFYIKA